MNADLFVELVVLERPVQASEQLHAERHRLFLRLEEGGLGYGEVAPQPHALNGDPGVDEVVEAARRALLSLEDLVRREGGLPAWNRVSALAGGSSAERSAWTLIEMALLDRELRQKVMSIGEMWPLRAKTPRQSTVSLLDQSDWRVHSLDARVRVKTSPGALNERGLEQLSGLRVPVLLDFNCSARSDEDVLAQVAAIEQVATLDAVEQPYGVGNLVDHARLAERLNVDVSLDESVRTANDLALIARHHAATMVCVKPVRVGGLAQSRSMFARAHQLGLRAYLGGFFESPYARRVHRALAYGAGVLEASDLGDVALEAATGEADALGMSFGLEPAESMLQAAECLPVLRGSQS